MTITEHSVVKPEKLADLAGGCLAREIVIPQLFAKQSADQYRGSRDDAINFRVPGVLTAHDYAWRNDRSQPIITDELKERTIQVKFGGHAYQAVQVTDEQATMDLNMWGQILNPQATAVARKLEYGAVDVMSKANYAVTLKATPDNVSNDIVEARRCLDLVGAPKVGRFLLVGADFEAVLQTDPTFNQAFIVGDQAASTALQDASIGKWKGFTVVSSTMIPAGDAYAFVSSAFAFLSMTPVMPDAVLGATTNVDGISLRWLRDYDSQYLYQRSVVDTFYGFQEIKDPIVYWDASAGTEKVSESEYLVRAVKLQLETGKDSYFASGVGSDAGAVGKALGLTGRSKATSKKTTTAPSVSG